MIQIPDAPWIQEAERQGTDYTDKCMGLCEPDEHATCRDCVWCKPVFGKEYKITGMCEMLNSLVRYDECACENYMDGFDYLKGGYEG